MSDAIWSQLGHQWESLPERLGGHIGLSLASLAVGILISIPLGIWAAKRPRMESAALLLASIIQTIPGLALLALMVFAWGRIGWLPAFIALVLYSILPMLRNTITGIKGIDPNLIEAARGVGMNDRQMLFKVQLPLAAPTMVAGIRTAAVWVVGAATIAQPVGATSLGNYIFVGLQTMNFVALLFGCVMSALLALSLDALLHGMELAVAKHNSRRIGFVLAGLALLAASPWLLRTLDRPGSARQMTANQVSAESDDKPFVIGCKAFTEQYILLDVIAKRLEAAGLVVETKDGMGSATVLSALESGAIDCYVDYTGTIWSNYMKRTEIASAVETRIDVATFLKDEKQILALGTLGFSNDYAFAMRKNHAAELGVETLEDLAALGGELSVGGDIEFFDRPEWKSVQAAYGIDFRQKRSMDSTLMYEAIAHNEVDVIVAFNTEGRLDAYDLAVIDDTKLALPPYDAVLLASARLARNAQAVKALRPLLESISSSTMRKANGLVDVQKQPVSSAADFLLQQVDAKE